MSGISIDYDKNAMLHVLGMVDGRAHMIAACQAIDAVSKQAVIEGRVEMQHVFKKPSPYTLRAMTRTTTQNGIPQAFVGINEDARYLVPQVKGGPRKRSRSEAQLNSALSPNRFLVPINPVKKRRSELIRILSFLKANADAYTHTSTKSLKRNKYLKKVQYSVEKQGGKTRIFAYDHAGGGKWRRLVYAGATQPKYTPRLDIEGVVDAVMFTRFKPAYQSAFEAYLARKKK